MRLFKFFNNKNKTDLLNIYSHPRSGTHFLEAFLYKNFYQTRDLNIPEITWGHWSNRKVKQDGNPYGKLFGHHFFPTKSNFRSPGIYIIRDGRAVAYSIWKTQNFLHKDIDGKLGFSEFIDTPLDWYGSPSKKSNLDLNIFEHWEKHCSEWIVFSKNQKKLLVVFYEDLKNNPYQVYEEILKFNFKMNRKLDSKEIDKIIKPIGLLPNEGKINSWKSVTTYSDLRAFEKIINKNEILSNKYL
jgi:hypothetical protein